VRARSESALFGHSVSEFYAEPPRSAGQSCPGSLCPCQTSFTSSADTAKWPQSGQRYQLAVCSKRPLTFRTGQVLSFPHNDLHMATRVIASGVSRLSAVRAASRLTLMRQDFAFFPDIQSIPMTQGRNKSRISVTDYSAEPLRCGCKRGQLSRRGSAAKRHGGRARAISAARCGWMWLLSRGTVGHFSGGSTGRARAAGLWSLRYPAVYVAYACANVCVGRQLTAHRDELSFLLYDCVERTAGSITLMRCLHLFPERRCARTASPVCVRACSSVQTPDAHAIGKFGYRDCGRRVGDGFAGMSFAKRRRGYSLGAVSNYRRSCQDAVCARAFLSGGITGAHSSSF